MAVAMVTKECDLRPRRYLFCELVPPRQLSGNWIPLSVAHKYMWIPLLAAVIGFPCRVVTISRVGYSATAPGDSIFSSGEFRILTNIQLF